LLRPSLISHTKKNKPEYKERNKSEKELLVKKLSNAWDKSNPVLSEIIKINLSSIHTTQNRTHIYTEQQYLSDRRQ
jgi:hypothetical protein